MKNKIFFVGLLMLLSACSLFMPDEIVSMEKRTSKIAHALKKGHPEYFHTYTNGNRPIHYVEVSDDTPKPLVIFIHGSPGSWKGWAEYLTDKDLIEKAHLIAVDRPGFGKSGKGKVERSLAQQAKDLSALLDKADKNQRVVLVGHSYGGPLVARLAMDNPHKITDIIILAGSIDPALEKTKWYQYPAQWKILNWAIPTDLLVTNREILTLKSDLNAMLPLWKNIHQRVTVIQGEKDDLVPPANADFAQKELINAKPLDTIRLPNNNHFLPWNQTELVKQTVLKHLQ